MKNKYSEIFKMLRVKHNETQAECAELIDKSLPAYRNKEKGISSFTIDEALVLLDHWGEPMNKLNDFL